MMIGAGFTYLLAQVKSFLQRQALIYGLMAAAGLILVFAIGYGLDAVRAMLALRVGGVYASVIIGGGLLAVALGCIGLGLYLGRASRPDDVVGKAAATLPDMPRLPRVTGSAMLAGGAVTCLVAGLLMARRSWRHGKRLSAVLDDEQIRHAPRR